MDQDAARRPLGSHREAAVKAALAEIPKTKKGEPKKPACPRYP